MLLALVARRVTDTNAALADAAPPGLDVRVLAPEQALTFLGPDDAALGRLDVLQTLDGVDDGLWALGALEAGGVRVLNPASALLATHDKLLTARLLRRARVAHPRTRLLEPGAPLPTVDFPVVVKPRFGSWGRDVELCSDRRALVRRIGALEGRPWFRLHGALVQDLVQPQGFDLRVVVVAGIVVGAIARVAAPGEWRTNVAHGAVRTPVTPPVDACELAVRAADAAGASLVGVDLLPDGGGGWVVLELNGAVDFTSEYGLGGDPFAAAARELSRAALGDPPQRDPALAAAHA